jgi:hypothetical protein
VAREWCVVFEAASRAAAEAATELLTLSGLDVEDDATAVYCFARSRSNAKDVARRARQIVAGSRYPDEFARPQIRRWSKRLHAYVDPKLPDADRDTGDPEIDPLEICWRVRVELQSVFDHASVKRRLRALKRPLIGSGNRHVDLGATSEGDASFVAAHARQLKGVRDAVPLEIRSRFRRWLVRQRLAGNYWGEPGSGAYDVEWGDAGGDGGGGDGGGGNGG